jgi:hypothetical protein
VRAWQSKGARGLAWYAAAMRLSFRLTIAAAAAMLGPGCGVILGLGDYPEGSDGRSDATVPGDGPSTKADSGAAEQEGATGDGADSGADGLVADVQPGDAGADRCVPTSDAEVCTDMIDNDCNGKIDCADPACAQQGFACVPDVPPGGWTYIALGPADAAAPSCPSTYTPSTYYSESGPNAVCPCGCQVTQAANCVQGTVTQNGGTNCTVTHTNISSTGLCQVGGGGNPVSSPLEYFPLAPSGGTCAPDAGPPMLPAIVESTHPACSTGGPFGGGCGAGSRCALAGGPLAACVLQAGVSACPTNSGYTQSQQLGLASGHVDGRTCAGTCAGCSAPTTGCMNPAVIFYSDTGCTTVATTVPADGTCHPTGSPDIASSRYSATAQTTCGSPAQMPSPTGSVAVNQPATICCAP